MAHRPSSSSAKILADLREHSALAKLIPAGAMIESVVRVTVGSGVLTPDNGRSAASTHARNVQKRRGSAFVASPSTCWTWPSLSHRHQLRLAGRGGFENRRVCAATHSLNGTFQSSNSSSEPS